MCSVCLILGCAPRKADAFVRYDPTTDQWQPTKFSGSPIPLTLEECTEIVKEFMYARKFGAGLAVDQTGMNTFVDDEGYLRGALCRPDRETCPTCGCALDEIDEGFVIIRTYAGAVKREAKSCLCRLCGQTFKWDSTREGIHMIGKEGGKGAITIFDLD